MLCPNRNAFSFNRNALRSIFTARKRSLGQGYVFTCVCDSVHGGGGRCEYLGRYPQASTTLLAGTPGQVHPLAGTPLGQVYPLGRYTPRQVHPQAGTPPGQVHPLGRYTPPPPQVHHPGQVHPQGRYTPWTGTPPSRYTPKHVHPQARTPSPAGKPPLQMHPGIGSTSRRYASYWNAFLSRRILHNFLERFIYSLYVFIKTSFYSLKSKSKQQYTCD